LKPKKTIPDIKDTLQTIRAALPKKVIKMLERLPQATAATRVS